MHVVEHAAAADDTHLRREVSPLREGGWGPKRSLNAKLVAVCRFFGYPHPEKSTGARSGLAYRTAGAVRAAAGPGGRARLHFNSILRTLYSCTLCVVTAFCSERVSRVS